MTVEKKHTTQGKIEEHTKKENTVLRLLLLLHVLFTQTMLLLGGARA